jgi:hypothetical protein
VLQLRPRTARRHRHGRMGSESRDEKLRSSKMKTSMSLK